MLVTKNTKIEALINDNKEVIEIIASINKNFNKLKNPILRKILANRITIKEAAKIGGVSTNKFLTILENNGFNVEKEKEPPKIQEEIIQKTIIMNHEKLKTLDVRPILAGGTDPFKAIMAKLKEVTNDETLLVINSFEPIPLLNKLKSQGYNYKVERPEEGVVYSYLSKGTVENTELAKKETISLDFSTILAKFAGKMKEIDVRPLEMPLPMVTILEEIEQLTDNHALFVNHKRLPQYLIPELESRGFVYASKIIDQDNTKLIIFKK